MTEISIIVPVYNSEKYLKETIGSILNQTFQDFELICVNDGSKDNSLEILNSFKEEDERIIVINQENQGVSTARNNAISIAKGKYIAFLDSDDLMHPTFLEKMHQIIEQENSDVVYCDYQNVPESCSHIAFKNYKELKIKSYNAPFQKYVNKVISVHVVIWNKFYKADIAKTIPFEKELSYAEDLIFTYLYLSKSKKITHLKQKLIFYRAAPTSLTRKKFNVVQISSHIEAFRILNSSFTEEKKEYRKFKSKFAKIVLQQVVYRIYKKFGKDSFSYWNELYDYVYSLRVNNELKLRDLSIGRRFLLNLYLKKKFNLLIKILQLVKK